MNTINATLIQPFNLTATCVALREFDNLACDLRVLSSAAAIASTVAVDNENEMKYKHVSKNYFITCFERELA